MSVELMDMNGGGGKRCKDRLKRWASKKEERRVKTKRYPEAVSSLWMMGVSDLLSLSHAHVRAHTHTLFSFYDQMRSRVQALKAVTEHSPLCLFSQDLNILANSRVPDSSKFCFCLFLMWTIFKSLYWVCYNIASVLCFSFLTTRHVDLNSLTRDGTCTPCVGRQSLNHWTPPGKFLRVTDSNQGEVIIITIRTNLH